MMKAIIFDIGGTLIYPARPVGETYAEIARAWHVQLDPLETTQSFARAFQTKGPRPPGTVPTNGDDRAWWQQLVEQTLNQHEFLHSSSFPHYFAEVYAYYGQPTAWNLFPEVKEVLTQLKSCGYTLAVLSNGDTRFYQVLKGHDLNRFFTHSFISTELGWEKPNPELYDHVAKTLRLPAHQLLSVGDDEINDYEAPLQAGWQAFLLNRPQVTLRDLYPKLSIHT